MGAWVLWLADALAGDGVRESLGSGLIVDWTALQVEVTAGSYRLRAQSTKAVEQSARLAVDDLLESELGVVRVAPGLDVAALLADPAFAAPLASRRSRWRVAEATYAASGKVDLTAQLSLQDFLKPWTLERTTPRPAQPPDGPHSGVIVDARGTEAIPMVAPRFTGPDGATIWAGELWDEDAVTTTPCAWLASDQHPSLSRAGDRPLRVAAAADADGVLVLDAAGAAAMQALLGTAALGRGQVVVLVDP